MYQTSPHVAMRFELFVMSDGADFDSSLDFGAGTHYCFVYERIGYGAISRLHHISFGDSFS